MKVIFLDFDGVLNLEQHDYLLIRKNPVVEGITVDGGLPLRRELCAKLDEIIAATAAKLVISSAWRKNYTNKTAEIMLKDSGCNFADVIGKTKDLHPIKNRGQEIEDWIREWQDNHGTKFESWVILDDKDWMLPHQKRNFVKTKEWVGLDDDDVAKAIGILNGTGKG